MIKNYKNQRLFILFLFSICACGSLFSSIKRKKTVDVDLIKKTKKQKPNNQNSQKENSKNNIEEVINLENFPKINKKKYLQIVLNIQGDFGDTEFPLNGRQIECFDKLKVLGCGNFIYTGPLIIYPVLSPSIEYGEKMLNISLNNPNWFLVFSSKEEGLCDITALTSLLWNSTTVPLENSDSIFLSEKSRETLNSLKLHHKDTYEKLISNVINLLSSRKQSISILQPTTPSRETVVTIPDDYLTNKGSNNTVVPMVPNNSSSKAEDLGLSPSFKSLLKKMEKTFGADISYSVYIPFEYRDYFYKEKK